MNDENILVIGYYDRQNIGDESYKIAFPILFKHVKQITFVCSDDIECIPNDVTTVVCGGGDIINEYFMKKMQVLLKNFLGRVYAVSVGIPYLGAVKYLHIFDHVFVRSMTDYVIASKEIGSKNVSYCRDISGVIPITATKRRYGKKLRVGICLAQPYFYNNPNKHKLIDTLSKTLVRLYKDRKNIDFHFLTFNGDETQKECDKVINNVIARHLSFEDVPYSMHDDLVDPKQVIDFINNSLDMTLCMRYHSVMFSVLTHKRFVPLYVSSKIRNLLKDLEYDQRLSVEMPVDHRYRPTDIDGEKLYNALDLACQDPYHIPIQDTIGYGEIVSKICVEKKLMDIMICDKLRSFDDVLSSCRRSLCKYLHIDTFTFEQLLKNKMILPLGGRNSLDVARFICFIVSGRTHHPCVWGLAEKIEDPDFDLYESIKYIWETCKTTHEQYELQQSYYPKPAMLKRKVLFNLDFVFQNDFSQYHRSGWSYVIGGLLNLDATHLMRSTDIMLDTYVDRSFHWGHEILKHMGIVPYVKPWYGFVHHTFNTDHSEYNCFKLLENPDFIESLKTCKGLLVLSEYLAKQFREQFDNIGICVPVHSLYHPMEFVDKVFTIDNFMSNDDRKIVQIGAWLRNPYGIFELPIPSNGGALKLTKVALKGKEMDQYFPPPGFISAMDEVLLEHDWFAKKHNSDSDATCHVCHTDMCRDCMCRPGTASVNKFCKGLFEHIVRQVNSVTILEKLNNDDYDTLLSENIVFLNLVDCSAANTVVECIVRNTPIIVNRIPSLEELLGVEYPGFYETYNEAADICQDIKKIQNVYKYLKRLDKDRYKLESFIDQLQDIIGTGSSNAEYNLFNASGQTQTLFDRRYSRLYKYLPRSFLKPLK